MNNGLATGTLADNLTELTAVGNVMYTMVLKGRRVRLNGQRATLDGGQQRAGELAHPQLRRARQAPGLVGANQFNVMLPANITSGVHTLTLTRGSDK